MSGGTLKREDGELRVFYCDPSWHRGEPTGADFRLVLATLGPDIIDGQPGRKYYPTQWSACCCGTHLQRTMKLAWEAADLRAQRRVDGNGAAPTFTVVVHHVTGK